MLKNVKPEDIEDLSERFVQLFAEDRDADTVKRIRISEGDCPLYLVALIEHKSHVDYNVTMQLLRYMVYIWEDYEKEQKRLHDADSDVKISSSRDFRYPFILPIVYYEAKPEWTAPTSLKERIFPCEGLEKYIPDFSYELIRLQAYTNEELLERRDEISVVMMFNKLRDREDAQGIREVSGEVIRDILADTPPYLIDLMSNIVRAFLTRIHLPTEESEQIGTYIKEGTMHFLFEEVEPIEVEIERLLADNDSKWGKMLADKNAEWNRIFAEKDSECNRILADKDTEYSKILADKDTEYSKILADKDTEYSKILAEKDAIIASLQEQLQASKGYIS